MDSTGARSCSTSSPKGNLITMLSRLARILGVTRLPDRGSSSNGRVADDWDRLRERAESDRERAELDAIFGAYTE
jgi:hypothetical protein